MFNTSSQDIKSVDFSPNISWLFSRIAIVWPPPLQHNSKYDAKNMFSSAQATQIPVRACSFVCTLPFQYRRLQSFQSLFGSPFSLVSIAVWIYFNRLQNTGALGAEILYLKLFICCLFCQFVSRPQGGLWFLIANFKDGTCLDVFIFTDTCVA